MGTGALGAIEAIDYALQQVNVARSTFGAAQNRFDAVISNLNVAMENQAAARSRIVDADYAAETARLARAQVLQQAGVAMPVSYSHLRAHETKAKLVWRPMLEKKTTSRAPR